MEHEKKKFSQFFWKFRSRKITCRKAAEERKLWEKRNKKLALRTVPKKEGKESKRSAQTRNVTQFKKNQFHSTTGFSLSLAPFFFRKSTNSASIVFYFILFMKTSGSGDGRGETRKY